MAWSFRGRPSRAPDPLVVLRLQIRLGHLASELRHVEEDPGL
jgi:hypothetical protein